MSTFELLEPALKELRRQQIYGLVCERKQHECEFIINNLKLNAWRDDSNWSSAVCTPNQTFWNLWNDERSQPVLLSCGLRPQKPPGQTKWLVVSQFGNLSTLLLEATNEKTKDV